MYTQHTNSRHISLSIKYFYIAYEAYRLLRVRLKSSYQLLAAIADIWAVSFVVGGGEWMGRQIRAFITATVKH